MRSLSARRATNDLTLGAVGETGWLAARLTACCSRRSTLNSSLRMGSPSFQREMLCEGANTRFRTAYNLPDRTKGARSSGGPLTRVIPPSAQNATVQQSFDVAPGENLVDSVLGDDLIDQIVAALEKAELLLAEPLPLAGECIQQGIAFPVVLPHVVVHCRAGHGGLLCRLAVTMLNIKSSSVPPNMGTMAADSRGSALYSLRHVDSRPARTFERYRLAIGACLADWSFGSARLMLELRWWIDGDGVRRPFASLYDSHLIAVCALRH